MDVTVLPRELKVATKGVAPVALGLAPAIRLDLDDAAVAQDRPPGEGRPEEQAAYELGRELVLDEVKEAVALGHRRVPSKVPCVERREAAAAQVPPVRLRLEGVAGELERGVREDGVGRQGRPGQERLDHGGSDVGAHQGLEARVGADREVARVRLRLGQEARAGDGVVDLRLGSPRRPVLGERGRELGVQLGPRVEREQLAGHVALRLGLRKVIREIHVPEGVCDLLIDFGLSVEVEQRGDDLGVDLAAVVVARQSRADGRGHRAAGGVVGQLARNEARDLRLGPVGEQGLVDQELHPPGVLVLADVQSVDGVGDGRVHLRGAAVGSQGIGDGRADLHRGAVGGQRGQDLVADPDLAGQRRQQGVGFRLAVRIAAEAQGPVVVGGELDAQRACGVQVSNLVGAGQQVPGHVAQPGGGVDQVGGAAEGGDLCEDPVDGGLQGELQVAEVPCRGEGPGVLEGQYPRVVPVEAGVLEGLSGLVGRLRQIAQERRGHPLIHVGRGLPGGHVDGQLVHHALQRIGRRDRRQGGVVGGGDAGVHRCCRRMVRQLEVHRGRRGFAVDLVPETVTIW